MLSGSDHWSTDDVKIPGLRGGKGPDSIPFPTTHPAHRIFTPCAVDKSGTQAMCKSPAKARVSPYKELTS